MYYRQSRYYAPEWGRFINADSLINSGLGVLGINLFTYCLNNPVISEDYNGESPSDTFASINAAAIDAALHMEKMGTFENAWEYGATIYSVMTYEKKTIKVNKNTLVGKIVIFVNTIRGHSNRQTVTYYQRVKRYKYTTPNTFRMIDFVLPPQVYNQVAIIHTHPYLTAYGSNHFSNPDKLYAKVLGIPYYLYTAYGRLLKYTPSTGIVSVICTDLPKDPHIP